ncbi:MAG: gliding motility-associated C-terminal domain-containing protein [Flavobacteriia bacterium]|nr:gliding motility-associated C-terminal domain-containing protein [Flavobacteriia bacterium]
MDIVGGFISWRNNGTGRYIFRLTLYRDCNGPDMENNSETLKIWNHPELTGVTVNFLSRISVTPTCTQVIGAPNALTCGTGSAGGNAVGTIEQIVYESLATDLNGKPPVEGWTVTFETLNRKSSINNLINPSTYGMTLSATLYENSPIQTNCMDNSPTLENPFEFIGCLNQMFEFMPYYQDKDMDFLHIRTANPLKNINSGAFEMGVNPLPVDFASGFSSSIPIPGSAITLDNSDLTLDSKYGDITFKTNTQGEYVVKFVVDSYRNGKKNASVDYEFTIFVIDCNNNANNAPVVDFPFVNSFETEVTAGSTVSFNISGTDVENLQDGSQQLIVAEVYSPMYGTNYSNSASGCLIVPCATLNTAPSTPIQDTKSMNFSWQTSCNHLRTLTGIEYDTMEYSFLFVFADNYCSIPKKTYKRVIINVNTYVELEPAKIDCIQTLVTGELLIQRSEPPNPNGIPVSYELHSIQNGFIGLMGSSSIVIPSSAAIEDYYIKSISGSPCTVALVGDTVENIITTITANPDNSVAILNWNSPYPYGNAPEGYYTVMREFPAGVWTEIAQVPLGLNFYYDTVDICNAFINYAIFFNKIGCSFNSNIVGENLQDGHIPNLPNILSVSINPVTGNTEIIWDVNAKMDTYGYIIYQRDEDNFSVEIDTVFGRTNTNEDYDLETSFGPLTFSVAAFDSCLTDLGTFYSTTGKCPEHTTMYLTNTYDICSKSITLRWTPYKGWESVAEYKILVQEQNGDLTLVGSTLDTLFEIEVSEMLTYNFVILAIHPNQTLSSYSNKSSRYTSAPTKPDFHYTKKVSVENNKNEITHFIENSTGVKEILIQKETQGAVFEEIKRLPADSDNIVYIDDSSEPDKKNDSYRVIYIDSCGNFSDTSNVSTSIFLSVKENTIEMYNQLSWTPYIGFAGAILYYNIYRGIDEVFDSEPLAKVPTNQQFYFDTLSSNISFNGNICYYVEVVEAMNPYMFQEKAKSNVYCTTFQPLVFIPNSFSPNNDDLNELFKVEVNINKLDFFQLTIMNRWGEVVFQTEDQNEAWNGNIKNSAVSCPQGSYLYLLKVKDGNSQEISKSGFVNLLR